jgi:hypothetical protein
LDLTVERECVRDQRQNGCRWETVFHKTPELIDGFSLVCRSLFSVSRRLSI